MRRLLIPVVVAAFSAAGFGIGMTDPGAAQTPDPSQQPAEPDAACPGGTGAPADESDGTETADQPEPPEPGDPVEVPEPSEEPDESEVEGCPDATASGIESGGDAATSGAGGGGMESTGGAEADQQASDAGQGSTTGAPSEGTTSDPEETTLDVAGTGQASPIPQGGAATGAGGAARGATSPLAPLAATGGLLLLTAGALARRRSATGLRPSGPR
jgi:hypothetical protein